MKKSLLPVALSAILIGLCVFSPAGAQAPAAPRIPTAVGVIDLNYIFKEHKRFQAMKKELDRQVQATQTSLNERRDQVKKMQEQLKGLGLTPGSPDYKARENQVTEEIVKLEADLRNQKREIVEREARIFFTILREVNEEVKYFAKGRYALIIQFNGEPIDFTKTDPNVVQAALMRPVVYWDEATDITPYILKALNGRDLAEGGGINPRPQPVPRRPN